MLDQRARGMNGLIPRFLGLAAGDRSGVRPVLRGRFAHPVAALEMAILFAAAWLSLGQPRLFMILFAIVAVSVAAEVALIRAGHPVATDTRFRLWLAAYPIGFAILGAAGWSQATGDYHGEVVALVALVAAGYTWGLSRPCGSPSSGRLSPRSRSSSGSHRSAWSRGRP
jgi:hypothetical protein